MWTGTTFPLTLAPDVVSSQVTNLVLLIAALGVFESGNNDYAVGRAGEVSRYQILPSEWRTVTPHRQYTDPTQAQPVACALAGRRVHSFRAIFHRDPTPGEFYGLWNAPGQVLRGRTSARVSERCIRFQNLFDSMQKCATLSP